MLLKGLDMGNTLKNEAKANLQAGAVNVTAMSRSLVSLANLLEEPGELSIPLRLRSRMLRLGA